MAAISDYLTTETVAWTAGLFEGEGCIGTARNKKKRASTPRLQLSMTDEDVVRRFGESLRLGRVNGPYRGKGGRKDHWSWNVTSFEKVQAIVAMFWPWLGRRRKDRAKEVLAEARLTRPKPSSRCECVSGHPLSGENLYVTCRGTRSCRICRLKRSNEYRARKRS